MFTTKILLNNFWVKNYFIKEVFFKDINKKNIKFYLRKQNYIKFDSIKKNFLMLYDKHFPIGYILQNRNKTVGFLGTLFSKRKIGNKTFLFCNIHSWLVDTKHRIASLILFKKILKKSVITVLTARPGLNSAFLKMGFKSLQMKYRILCLINFSCFVRNKNKTNIITNKSLIIKKITKENIQIYNDHSDKRFIKFIVFDKNITTDYSFVVGRFVIKRKYLGTKAHLKSQNYLNLIHINLVKSYIGRIRGA